MAIKKMLGIWIVGLSIAMACLLALWFLWIGAPIRPAVMAWPAIGLLLGLMVSFGNLLEGTMKVVPEDLPRLLHDDIKAWQDRRITLEHLYVVATGMAAIMEFYLLAYYRKWLASWDSINVTLVALVVVLVVGRWMLRTPWFQVRIRRTGAHFFVIAALGWLVCISLGIYWAEPPRFGRLSPLQKNQVAASELFWGSTRAGIELSSNSLEVVGFSCDDDLCGVLFLVIVVIACISGSATIPHFWVVATMLLLTIMAVITIRELLYRKGYEPLKRKLN